MSDIDIEALRAMTPGCVNRIHLNNAGAVLLSSPTIAAMTDHVEQQQRHRTPSIAGGRSGRLDPCNWSRSTTSGRRPN